LINIAVGNDKINQVYKY